MGKKVLFLLIVLFFAAGCAPSARDDAGAEQPAPEAIGTEQAKKPRIPGAHLKASVLGESDADPENDTKKVLDAIEKSIAQPAILYQDIERGWYYGSLNEKKLGTPDTWIWVAGGKKSRWVSPNTMEKEDLISAESLCRQTAGTYVISCIDSDAEDCEYVPENTCRCTEGSQWEPKEGCILVDGSGDFVEAAKEEIARGWYSGLLNQKKLGTPAAWVWVEAGQESRWKNPSFAQ